MVHSRGSLARFLCDGMVLRLQIFEKSAHDSFWGDTMSRPMALGLVLLVLILTSQSEWKQQPKTELELTAAVSKEQKIANKREQIKEEIILSQERKIFNLNALVKSLRQQLAQCQENIAENVTEVVVDPQSEVAKIEVDV